MKGVCDGEAVTELAELGGVINGVCGATDCIELESLNVSSVEALDTEVCFIDPCLKVEDSSLDGVFVDTFKLLPPLLAAPRSSGYVQIHSSFDTKTRIVLILVTGTVTLVTPLVSVPRPTSSGTVFKVFSYSVNVVTDLAADM
jgi:hypothetical protein